MTVEEASGPPVEVWPDNVDSVNAFVAMATQWRTGFAGATGLDYSSLPVVFNLLGVSKAARAAVFDGVRLMEDAALECLRAKK